MVVSMIEGTLRIQLLDGSWREAAASSGFATVLPDEVDVMLQTAEWPEDIDENRAREAARIARERLRQQKSMQEYHLARTMLARRHGALAHHQPRPQQLRNPSKPTGGAPARPVPLPIFCCKARKTTGPQPLRAHSWWEL